MSVWGTAIFSDDTASDVREAVRAAVAKGRTPEAVTDEILVAFATNHTDQGYAATVWIALALTSWKLGRPETRARDTALAAIDDGHAITAWLGSSDEGRRRCAFVELFRRVRFLTDDRIVASLVFAGPLDFVES